MPARSSTKLGETLRMVRPRTVTSSAMTVSASWAPPASITARPSPTIATGTRISRRGSRYTPAVTTIVSPGRASRSAPLTVEIGPAGATTRRRAGGCGADAITAAARARPRLPIVPPGREPIPGHEGSTQPCAQTVGGGPGPERGQMARHRGRERIHPEVERLTRIEQRVRLQVVVHPETVHLRRRHRASVDERGETPDVIEHVDLPRGRHQLGREPRIGDGHVAMPARLLAVRDGPRRGPGAAEQHRARQRERRDRQPDAHAGTERARATGTGAGCRTRRHSSTATVTTAPTARMVSHPPMPGHEVAWKLSSCLLPMTGG